MRQKIIAASMMICLFWSSVLLRFGTDLCYGMTENSKETINSFTGIVENEGEQSQPASGAGVSVEAPSAVLMEASTGTVIYEKASKEQLRPASITKIMTLILIFDALSEGKVKLNDVVTTSEYASSMGGSQVFLEANEQQTVETMIKCISVASANDACVAMAEHIWGSEEAFVEKMNARAQGLGMGQTHFVNCCGLDVDGHVTSAMDVALMSRELITKYPEIHNYCTIWMENITHTTAKGSSEFGLTNTNKLIKQYPYATGLKTGSTSLAKYCVSATARKEDVDLIAVIMAAPDYKVRFKDAATLLNYGFANCTVYRDQEMPKLKKIAVKDSLVSEMDLEYQGEFSYLGINGEDFSKIEKKLIMPESLKAPVKKGDVVGRMEYRINDKVIGEVSIVTKNAASKAGLMEYYKKVWSMWSL